MRRNELGKMTHTALPRTNEMRDDGEKAKRDLKPRLRRVDHFAHPHRMLVIALLNELLHVRRHT